MTIWESIVLGAIQGLTEFLPVSSSGHLEIANHLFGIEEPSNMGFTMALHAGTVLSTIVVFAREIWKLLQGLFKFRMNKETVFCINILISMIPIAFVGLMFGDRIESLFTSNLLLVGCMLLVTAALLAFSHYVKPRSLPVTPQSAFIIGIAQAVAVIPGLSRSGATISTGLLLGVKREETAKFSFLMVLIPIIGMNLLELFKGGGITETMDSSLLLAGFLTAFITGAMACKWMIRVISRGKLIWFAIYCCVAGVASIIMNFIG